MHSGHGRAGASLVAAACILAISLASSWAQPSKWELVVCADPNTPPFSVRDGSGFENRIADIIADEIGATLGYYWVRQAQALINDALRSGACDVIFGLAEGAGAVLTTLTYYRSPYVFVYRADADYDIFTFDDPILRELRIGVGTDSPAHLALFSRGLDGNIAVETQYLLAGIANDVLERIVSAVAVGDIDVAVVWGPGAGYYASRHPVNLTLTAVPPFDPPAVQMYINIVAGVRLGDEDLRDLLDVAIVNRWDEIQAALDAYDIPRMPLTPPILTIEPPG